MLWNLSLRVTEITCLRKRNLKILKQECKLESLDACIRELQRQAQSHRLEMDSANSGYEESRGASRRIGSREKKALRDTRIRNIHEMEELRRAQEMRVDEFSMQTLRESYAAIQKLTSQTGIARKGDLYDWFKRISRYRIDLQWKIISRSQSTGSRSKPSIYVEPRPKPATWYMEFVWDTRKLFWQPTRNARVITDTFPRNSTLRIKVPRVKSQCRGVQGDLSRKVKNKLEAEFQCRVLQEGHQPWILSLQRKSHRILGLSAETANLGASFW